ncbi:low molecular weight phosphatase family protein [Gordonia sp. ABKF26]|uniref:arsenate-mycothiol transferase ArsC n=1 Tax=Gordonia sp. ABKF26 TaxID=3238687 RepID=UPI0034E40AC2
MSDPLEVLFVCVSNRGKSVMAEHLTTTVTDRIAASSAGTSAKIGGEVNELSAHVLAEIGVDVAAHRPRQLTDDLMRAADLVVVVGTAEVTPPDGVSIEEWNTVEPADRGVDGLERMRLIRDDITTRVRDLTDRLQR